MMKQEVRIDREKKQSGRKTLGKLLFLASLLIPLWPTPGLAQESQIFRLVTFSSAGDSRLGATQGEGQADIVDVHHAIQYLMREQPGAVRDLPYIPADMKTLIEAGSESIRAVRNVYQTITRLKASAGFTEPGGAERVFHPPTSVRLLCPIPNPSKVIGMAGNYAREGDPPEYPSAFLKSVSALVGHEEVIDLAGLVTVGVHEPELAFVIGKRARNVPEAQAFDYVVGYTIVNDVTARDLPQGNHPAQGSAISKSLDTFAPCGPYLTLKEDVPDPHNLAIGARINGQAWEIPNANTRHLIFKIPQIIAYLSQRMTLMPGDIIATGVPAPVVPLRAGDTAEMIIEKLGTLRNRVVAKQ
ncbi:MAG: fumarylacetoacetate hydrolase family protein [Acidobacteria bacterium]|nr:fumarylacetoacetate hydrolase family protein [Acidobacteriota bacterium]